MKQRTQNYLFGGTILALLAYSTARAVLWSMTHDESSTYLNYIDMNIWLCYHNPKCWGTANLHWLNTLIMQPAVKIFGVSEFSVRLPNLLTHAVYLVFSWLLLRDMRKPFWITFAAFLILNLSPYLLDFFSLARGYGMACGWMMMSLYYLWKYIEKEKNGYVFGSFLGASLAVLSNFVYLNYLMALTGVFFLWQLYQLIESKKISREMLMQSSIPIAFILVLGLALYQPIQFLSSLGEFKYGATSLYTTLETLVRDYLQTKADGYFGKSTLFIFCLIAIGLVLLTTFRAVRQFIQLPKTPERVFLLASTLVLLLVILIQKVQFHVMGTNYLVQRTALIFIPLALLPVVLNFLLWDNRWAQRFLLFAGIFSIYHFHLHINFQNCREWWFDMHTKNMALYVNEVETDKPLKLGVHWTFHPSTMYYWKTGQLKTIDVLLYSKELRTDDYFDYYYVPSSDTARLHPSYRLEKEFGNDYWLYRK